MSSLEKILIQKNKDCKSIWFMRQAGRYLPEFKKIRLQNKNFIDLCLNSELSSEITLQPIKRFNIDSAIIFSDILMTPYALGQEVKFIKDQGPVLNEFDIKNFSKKKEKEFTKKLSPVYRAIEITRKKLDGNKSLIAFIGAPWTLLIYMLNLKENKIRINLNKLNKEKITIDRILDKLIDFLCIHIKNQINAGADVVQIFDSWAGILSLYDWERLIRPHLHSLLQKVGDAGVPRILFLQNQRVLSQQPLNQYLLELNLNLDY